MAAIETQPAPALSSSPIARVHMKDLSVDAFVDRYLAPNKPVIISGLTDTWLARHKWIIPSSSPSSVINASQAPSPDVTPSSSPTIAAVAAAGVACSVPNFDHLRDTFGASICQVAECAQRSYSEQKRSDMSMTTFLSSWHAGDYSTPLSCRYLKDWHMTADCKDGYMAYETPPHFQDDWMNAYWDAEGKDDFRFVYMGPNHTWTPLHRDVYKSYSWSTNICGRKRWIMYPPHASHHLFDTNGHLAYDVSVPIDTKRFPHFNEAQQHVMDIIQEEGETIFVPSGWYHQVHNLCDVISLNHNWCNTYNILGMWQHIQQQRRDVINALNGYNFDAIAPVVAQLKPPIDVMLTTPPSITDDEIETVLRAECGIDLVAFWRFLVWNAHRLCTLLALPASSSSRSSDTATRTRVQGLHHIATILDELVHHPVLQQAMLPTCDATDAATSTPVPSIATATASCPLTLMVESSGSSSSVGGVSLRPSAWPVIATSLASLHHLIARYAPSSSSAAATPVVRTAAP